MNLKTINLKNIYLYKRGIYMYKNYIFDLYGTLVDINTDEDKSELWDKLSLFYSLKGAKYKAKELKDLYSEKVKKELELINDTKYPDFSLEKVFFHYMKIRE